MPYVRSTISVGLVAFAALALTACNDASAAREESDGAREASAPGGELVMLADGTTMISRSGTLSRNVADWLAGDEPSSRMFAFGPGAFVAETGLLSPHGLGTAADLGTLLRATPNARLILDGAASPMAAARAQTLANFLAQRGILSNQVMVSTDEAAGRKGAAKAQDDLSFWLERSKGA